MRDLLAAIVVLGLPSAAVIFARRAHRTPLAAYELQIAPRTESPEPTPDVRTAEQKAADQAGFGQALGLRARDGAA